MAEWALSGDWGTARRLPFAHRWSLRVDVADLPAIAEAWGPMPARILTSKAEQDRAALMLGPDEWLLIAQTADAVNTLAKAGPALSLVDVSQRSRCIETLGPGAADLLNAGVPLDLADAAFPPGMATRTILAKAEIILWRPGPDRLWHIDYWRSFGDYVERFLAQAAAGL